MGVAHDGREISDYAGISTCVVVPGFLAFSILAISLPDDSSVHGTGEENDARQDA